MSQKSPSALSQGENESQQSQSLLGCLIQLAWSLGGFGVLVILFVLILRERPWSFTLRDVLYWAAVLGMICARHVDVVRYGARTSSGEAATARDVRCYALGLVGATALLWCVAQAFQV